ncbi:ribonuclease J [Pararhizobium mangrovi]|uniref:Ribonuclease J n=1 Tax=Pararhizobium mangrovi TaxID=2590452 RepID=A0A506U7S7_9HYPH|nr:ribonuclease J [Pararhizobium mangrovi]TPW30472.1 ribonuclease J [Pararhizobium mangrovi]
MNLALYGYGRPGAREWIMVDCGVTFPGPDLPGVDLVLPDISYLAEEKANLKGIVITHAHEDHYGALADLWPGLNVPIYASPFAAGMLEAKQAYEKSETQIPVTVYRAGERFTVGPFEIEAVPVNHSIPEPASLAIRTPLGTVLHSGDWKIDAAPALGPLTNADRFREIGDEGVLALMCDSTNAMREGVSPSEQEVAEGLEGVIANAKARVAVTSFSSNVGRIRSVIQAATKAGREVVLVGNSIKRVVGVARDVGLMDDIGPFVDEAEYGYLPRDKVVLVLTGSQGESRAALARVSRDEMRDVALAAGDTVVFSSRTIPGNEKAIGEIKNALVNRGIHIVSDSDALVHVSGHPRRSELRQMYEWVRPKILVPVHGEPMHLEAHAALGREVGGMAVPRVRNGEMLRLAPGEPEIVDTAPCGRIFRDGKIIGDAEEVGVVERRKLSYAGHVAVNVVLDGGHELARDPEIETNGLPVYDGEGDEMVEILLDAAVEAIEGIPRNRRRNTATVHEAVRRSVRSAARIAWGKKPVVTVFVTEL